MQLIDCPWCGCREEIEFSYGAEAHIPYPDNPAELNDTQWAHYVFFRSNPKGVCAERWVHSAGCRRWFNALRDTCTYHFIETYRIGEAPSSAPASLFPVTESQGSVPTGAEDRKTQ